MLTQKLLIKGIHPDNLPKMEQMLDQIIALILQNPFSEKMLYLIHNQHLAKVPVPNVHNISSPPNCIGTTFFIARTSILPYPYHAYSDELNPHMKRHDTGNWQDMLRTHLERREPGAFIFSYSVESDGWHAGIYLGEIHGNHIAFSQHDHGGAFGPELISSTYENPDYYTPSTLHPAASS